MSNEVSCDSVARRVNGEKPLDVLVGVSTPYGPLLTDFLCLGVVSRRMNIRFVEGGGAMV